MPGPPLAKKFTYTGTPNTQKGDAQFNKCDREVIQSNRFYLSKDTGTHSRIPYRKNIPQNSGKGIGGGGGLFQTAGVQY